MVAGSARRVHPSRFGPGRHVSWVCRRRRYQAITLSPLRLRSSGHPRGWASSVVVVEPAPRQPARRTHHNQPQPSSSGRQQRRRRGRPRRTRTTTHAPRMDHHAAARQQHLRAVRSRAGRGQSDRVVGGGLRGFVLVVGSCCWSDTEFTTSSSGVCASPSRVVSFRRRR